MSPEQTSALAELREMASALRPDVRALIALGWARAAQAEHASIASFARVTLELLAVGAPPELISDAERAGLDEVAHAELAFAIASVYEDQSLGPGRLPLGANVIGAIDLQRVIESTIAEGCIGETLAAAEAAAARDMAVPTALKNALRRVASDEAAHAAFAYRVVAWGVGVGGPSAREAARAAFAREIERVRNEPLLEGPRESMLRGHGLLPAPERHALRLEVLSAVIVPAARELLGRESAGLD